MFYRCFIESFFVRALAYADDIVLLAPTDSAMRKMLKICEEYAGNLSVIFNASKSKCVVCQSKQRIKTTCINSSIQFAINSSPIDVVNSWPHLGHVISSDINDKSDIERCYSKLVAQINCVLCSFVHVDANIKTKLLKSYCLSLYGCELWDLCHVDIEMICKSWWLGLRHTWGLPNDCQTMILQLLSGTLPLYDLIYKRSLSFIKRCLASENDLVSFVSHYSVLYGGMSSNLGRNVISCSRHYQLPVNYLLSEQFNATIMDKICTSRTLPELYSQSMSVLEFIILKCGIISIPDIHFDCTDVTNCLITVCSRSGSRLTRLCLCVSSFLFTCLYFCLLLFFYFF